MTDNRILLGGRGTEQVFLDAVMANRHGLITGATGTGKTVTLEVLGGRQGIGEAMATSLVRTIGSTSGRTVARGLLGSITGKR